MSLRSRDPKYVFFSYKRQESLALVRQIQEHSLGQICMEFDLSLLVPGRPWQPQLELAISRADVFVFVISPGSVASFSEESCQPTCSWEANLAIELNKDIVPVLWESCPDYRYLPSTIRDLHWVDFEKYRLSGLTDPYAFGSAWDRLNLGINGNTLEWIDESMEWFMKLDDWRTGDYHEDFLLTEAEMRDFERFLRRTPPDQSHILDHPLMHRFIRLNRVKWPGIAPSSRRF